MEKKKSRKRKIKILAIIFLGFLLLSVIVVAIYVEKKSIVAEVNGQTVTVHEFRAALSNNYSDTFAYFSREYNAQDGSEFWTTAYDGEIPVVWLRERALEECIENRIRFALAEEYGLVEEPGYGYFQNKYTEENKRRKEAVKEGNVIYGPTQYKEADYYNYIQNNIDMKLKEKLGALEEICNEEELKKFYEEHKEEMYQVPEIVNTYEIIVPYSDDEEKREAWESIQKISQEIQNGASFESEMLENNQENEIIENSYMPDNPRTRGNSVVIETISSMEIEEISEVLEDMTAYKIIQCKERIPSSVAEYGQVKESIKKAYLDQWYEDYLEDLVQTAEVEINERVYSKEFIAKLG